MCFLGIIFILSLKIYFQEYFRTLFHNEWGDFISKTLTFPSFVMNLRTLCTVRWNFVLSLGCPRESLGGFRSMSAGPPTPSHRPRGARGMGFWKLPRWPKCAARLRTIIPGNKCTAVCYSGLLQIWLIWGILAQFQSKRGSRSVWSLPTSAVLSHLSPSENTPTNIPSH